MEASWPLCTSHINAFFCVWFCTLFLFLSVSLNTHLYLSSLFLCSITFVIFFYFHPSLTMNISLIFFEFHIRSVFAILLFFFQKSKMPISWKFVFKASRVKSQSTYNFLTPSLLFFCYMFFKHLHKHTRTHTHWGCPWCRTNVWDVPAMGT